MIEILRSIASKFRILYVRRGHDQIQMVTSVKIPEKGHIGCLVELRCRAASQSLLLSGDIHQLRDLLEKRVLYAG